MFSVILGQCTDAMIARLKGQDIFEEVEAESDALCLLKMICGIAFNFESQKYVHLSMHEAMRRYYLTKQDRNMTCQAYLDLHTNNWEVVEHCSGMVGVHPGLINAALEDMDVSNVDLAMVTQMGLASEKVKEAQLAIAFLMGADRVQYGGLLAELENDYLKGSDQYPKTMVAAYNLLVNYKIDMTRVGATASSDGMAFTNVDGDSEDGDEANEGTTLAMQGQVRHKMLQLSEDGALHAWVPREDEGDGSTDASGNECNGSTSEYSD